MHWPYCLQRRNVIAFLTLVAMAIAASIASYAMQPHDAEAAEGTISGTAHVERIMGSKDPTLFNVTMPDGQVLVGSCLDPELPAPKDGDYEFVATRNDEGTYDVDVKTQYTTMDIHEVHEWSIPAIEADPPYTTQRVGDFRWDGGKGSIRLVKSSSLPDFTEGNDLYDLAGAEYGIYADEACSSLVTRLKTSSDGTATAELAPGRYYVKEIAPSKGYEVSEEVIEVAIHAGKETSAKAQETPRCYDADIIVKKIDHELAETGSEENGAAQGSATLAGAVFEATFYPGTSDRAMRTWRFKTDTHGIIRFDEAHKTEGDALFFHDGKPAIPLGRIEMREVEAPQGYLPVDDTIRLDLSDASQNPRLVVNPATVSERVKRGGISLQKLDKETDRPEPSGKAALERATYDITSDNPEPIIVNGAIVKKGEVALSLTTDANGFATTKDDALPYGRYVVRETVAPEGYLIDDAFEARVDVSDHHAVVEAPRAKEQIKRGDISFVKRASSGQETMPNVVFALTSETTGEKHVIVTDENGIASTSAEHTLHTLETNGNDSALDEDAGRSLLPKRGVWFYGVKNRADGQEPHDDLGALPYDSYTLEELRCAANEGKELVTQKHITITSHAKTIDLGTIEDDDMVVKTPRIGTVAKDAGDGDAIIDPTAGRRIIDTVAYEDLEPGTTYRIEGRLMDKESGKELVVNGTQATAQVEFTPQESKGTCDVPFDIDARDLGGKKIVVYERLLEKDDVVATHEDMDAASQTVSVAPRESPRGPLPKTGLFVLEHGKEIAATIGAGLLIVAGSAVLRKRRSASKSASRYRW